MADYRHQRQNDQHDQDDFHVRGTVLQETAIGAAALEVEKRLEGSRHPFQQAVRIANYSLTGLWKTRYLIGAAGKKIYSPRHAMAAIGFPRTCSSRNSGRLCLIGMDVLADSERRNEGACKSWREQYLRLAMTIKPLRQALTVCQRAWLADCELRTISRLCVCSAALTPPPKTPSLRALAPHGSKLACRHFPGWQSKSAIARLNR